MSSRWQTVLVAAVLVRESEVHAMRFLKPAARTHLHMSARRSDTEPPSPSSFAAYEPVDWFRFEIVHESRKPGSLARVGRIHTPHGIIDTPGFVPVGTNGALKAMTNEQATAAGVQLMFCNTYHLLVHPGPEVVAAAGGLHSFMKRDAPLITDSGGFQACFLRCVRTWHSGLAVCEPSSRGSSLLCALAWAAAERAVVTTAQRDRSAYARPAASLCLRIPSAMSLRTLVRALDFLRVGVLLDSLLGRSFRWRLRCLRMLPS